MAQNMMTTEQHPYPVGATATLALTAGGSFSDAVNASVSVIPAAFTIVSINGDPLKTSLDAVTGASLNGLQDIAIVRSCDGTATPGGGCIMGTAGKGDLMVLTAITSLTPRGAAPDRARYGLLRCVDEAGNSSSHAVTLSKQAIRDIRGTDTGASIKLELTHFKARPSISGAHVVFVAAGHGAFTLQNL